jgi:hypothetical protein
VGNSSDWRRVPPRGWRRRRHQLRMCSGEVNSPAHRRLRLGREAKRGLLDCGRGGPLPRAHPRGFVEWVSAEGVPVGQGGRQRSRTLLSTMAPASDGAAGHLAGS